MVKALILGTIASLSLVGLYYEIQGNKINVQESTSTVDPLADQWEAWKAQHGKKYGADQGYYRFKIWKSNNFLIESHNQMDGSSYYLGHNEFSDLTQEEFKALYLGTKKETSQRNEQYLLGHESLSDSVDWRTKGAVTPVKNQGQCGSCWAFSTTGALEGLNFIQTGELLSFSEQALVDCSKNGNEGCNGGLMDQAFDWVSQNGIPTESAYPYKGRDQTCQTFTSAFKDAGFVDVPANTTTQMTMALNKQPVAVAIDASSFRFQFYMGGIMNFNCGTDLDHGVLAVGYGSDSSEFENAGDYWIVKNSWGTGWGEKGYFRMSKTNQDGPGMCGILMSASYPTA